MPGQQVQQEDPMGARENVPSAPSDGSSVKHVLQQQQLGCKASIPAPAVSLVGECNSAI